MAAVQGLSELLNTLTSSLNTLSSTLPATETLKTPIDGISLLDTKNELFLSYLQNLVFLILLKIRNAKSQFGSQKDDGDQSVADETVKKLVELRVYLDRGAKPLENKLRYQIDKAVRAADHHEARSQRVKTTNGAGNAKKKAKSHVALVKSSGSSSDSDNDEDEASDSASDAAAPVFQSNIASFVRPTYSKDRTNGSSQDRIGVYRPPRIAAVAPPTTNATARQSRRPIKSHLLDEYIASELSGAPVAEPSIGANILDRGRGDVMSVRERNVAVDRQRYEEENLMRLPGMAKKEKRRLEGDRAKRGQFGGEEWSGLGGSADRIVELTKRSGGRGGTKGALERSRKRGRDGDAGDGDGGAVIGDRFERKRRQLASRASGKRK